MAKPIVVFDLGGVMVRVAQTWRDAIEKANAPCGDPENAERRLSECPGFDAFQRAHFSTDAYLDALDEFLVLGSREVAHAVHQGILLHPFSGTLELVDELHGRGIRTGILSNTNAPHWDLMSDPNQFPAIAALQTPALSHELLSEKPDPEIYQKAEALFGASGADIFFFDDLSANIDAARSFGWNAHVVDPVGSAPTLVREVLRSATLL